MKIINKIKKHGIVGSAKRLFERAEGMIRHKYQLLCVKDEPRFRNPIQEELVQIENQFLSTGVAVEDYSPSVGGLKNFQEAQYFPLDYHGGVTSPVWNEKLLEHWLAAELLGLMDYRPVDVYVDIAAGSSPWARTLRERLGLTAFAIDLEVGPAYQDLSYYRVENATFTKFADGSVRGASLQCAYEMFMQDDDTNLLKELARILKPGGKAVIVPLYMHTHYCAYSTPEHYGKGYSDRVAKEYVCCDWRGIPSARFYDVDQLNKRVLSQINNLGMKYRLLALRNKADFGKDIYCHFILEITK